MFKAAIVLSQQLNITIEDQLIEWQVGQTGSDIIDSLSSTCRVMSTLNIIGIVGPAFSREVPFIAALAKKIGIPTISYSATDPELFDKNASPAFYRTIPSDNTAALAIVKLFVQFNWTACIVIYQNDEFGIGGADAISKAFNQNNLIVSETLLFDISTLTFRGDLKTTLLTSSTRIVLLWAEPLHTSSILQSALDNDVLGPQFQWILCSSISLNSFNQTFYPNLIGILTIQSAVGNEVGAPVNTTLLNAAYAIWQQYEPETFPGPTHIDNYAFFAFDATWALIEALQKLCSTGINSSSSCLSFVESSFCFDRRFLNANSFFNTISTTEFLGVSGPIQFSNNTTDRINGTYYIAKNVQPSSNGVNYVPVLQWSGSSKWETATQSNVIIWPGNSLIPPTGIAGLSGVTLRIGVVKVPPFTMTIDVINESGQTTKKLIGYMQDLIELLQKAMGFTADIILIPSNQTFDQTIQAVANNVYDMVVSDVTVTAKRREIVDFSTSIYDNSLRVIIRQGDSVKVNLLAFLKPFSPRLWFVILGAFIYGAILICILEARENEVLKQKSLISSGAMSAWYSFGTMVGFGVDFHVQTAAGRLLSVGMYILSIILVATYTANLTSNLTLAKSTNIISGIEDIKNGKIPFSRIGIVVGTGIEDYYLREISGGSRNFYRLKSQSEIYSSLLNNIIDAAISDTSLLEYATSTIYCNLTLAGSDFNPNTYGIVIRKQWIYAQALDVNILLLRESGALDDLQAKWFNGKNCSDSSGTGSSTGETIQAIGGLFLTSGIISLLSLLLFAWSKRFIIKYYLRTLAHRKGWLAQQNSFVERSPT